MRTRIPGGVTRLAPLLSLFLLGCGPDFDPPSELHSLRVLAVQKDEPYAQPGSTVNLSMFWQDASPASLAGDNRAIQVRWSPPCFDPPGDLYYGCFSNPSSFEGMLKQGADAEHTAIDIPPDIISRRPPVNDGSNNAPYGLTYVFFALCAGELKLLTAPSDGTTFPVTCQDADGKVLGADDFVAGYTSIYSFEGISNHNPVIGGFEFRGQPLMDSEVCLDQVSAVDPSVSGTHQDCQPLAGSTPAADIDCTQESTRCVPTCADDGDSTCPAYSLRPSIDKNIDPNKDVDEVSKEQLGRTVGEQMWVNYYTDAGGFKSPVRLLNDATNGWNDDYGTEFYAPKKAGPFRIWAVAHDNRGGVAWAGITLEAQ